MKKSHNIFLKRNKVRAAALVSAMLVFTPSVMAYAAPENTGIAQETKKVQETKQAIVYTNIDALFDAEYYAKNNPDVVAVFGTNPEALLQHFKIYGLKEGRCCSSLLDVAKYRALYPDLEKVFGDNWNLYVAHYFLIGGKEGRSNGVAKESQKENAAYPSAVDRRVSVSSNGTISDDQGNILIPWEVFENEPYLTLDTLRQRCGDTLILLQNENGQVTFVGGNFSDVKVTDTQTAIESVHCMVELLKFPEETTVLAFNHSGQDSLGNTYYRFGAQLKGTEYVEEGYALIVTADQNGQVLSLSSGLTGSINQNAADTLTYQACQNDWWSTLDEDFQDPEQYECLSSEPELVFSSRYNSYFWCKYYYNKETGLVEEISISANATDDTTDINKADVTMFHNYYDYDNYLNGTSYQYDFLFEGKKTELKTFIDGFGNMVELPCARDENGYYILDTSRRIISICSEEKSALLENPARLYFPEEYFDAIANGATTNEEIQECMPSGEKTPTAEELSTIVSAITTITLSYDEYQNNHMLSAGKPLLVNFLVNTKEDNAYCSNWNESILFGINNYYTNREFDGVSHELGHGVLGVEAGYLPYQDATGAINESYADILGNMLEMYEKKQGNYEGYVDFNNWLIGEFQGGSTIIDGYYTEGTIRDMSDPEHVMFLVDQDGNPMHYYDENGTPLSYINENGEIVYYVVSSGGQPSTVGGENYVQPGSDRDYGGVHTNSGILNNVCYHMYQELFGDTKDQKGETYMEMFDLWSDTLQYLTQDTSYLDEMYYMQQSMRNHGYSDEKIEKVAQIFENAIVTDQKKEQKRVQIVSPDFNEAAAKADITETETANEELEDTVVIEETLTEIVNEETEAVETIKETADAAEQADPVVSEEPEEIEDTIVDEAEETEMVEVSEESVIDEGTAEADAGEEVEDAEIEDAAA